MATLNASDLEKNRNGMHDIWKRQLVDNHESGHWITRRPGHIINDTGKWHKIKSDVLQKTCYSMSIRRQFLGFHI